VSNGPIPQETPKIMQNQPPPGYQPGSWQQPDSYQAQQPMPPAQMQFAPPRTQTLDLQPNVAAGLCYLPFFFIHLILPIVFLVSEPKSSRFVRFHAFQALFLTLTGFVGSIACYIAFIIGIFVAAFAAMVSPVLAILVGALGIILLVSFIISMFVCTIISCIKAFNGDIWKVPVIGNLAERCAS
jgi:uncharacterized membrane protein